MLRRIAVLSARFMRLPRPPRPAPIQRNKRLQDVPVRKPDPIPPDLLRQDRTMNQSILSLAPVRSHILNQQKFALDHIYPSGPGSFNNPALRLIEETPDIMEASSTLKKRRLKMNKHKYRKRRKRDRRRTK